MKILNIKKWKARSWIAKLAITLISIFVIVWIMLSAYSFFLPSIKVINKTNQTLDIYVPQYPYIVEDNRILAGCCPTSRDLIEMSRKRGTLKPNQSGTYSLDIGNLHYSYPDDFFMLEVKWENSIKDKVKNMEERVRYRLLDMDEDQSGGVCHVTATVTDDGIDIKESSWKYCFKKFSKDIGVSIE